MGPSQSARLFGARMRLYATLTRAVRGFDGSDVLTVLTLALLGIGVGVTAGFGWACIVLALALSLLTPLGTALRVFIRGR